jgi:hypothetical protein
MGIATNSRSLHFTAYTRVMKCSQSSDFIVFLNYISISFLVQKKIQCMFVWYAQVVIFCHKDLIFSCNKIASSLFIHLM